MCILSCINAIFISFVLYFDKCNCIFTTILLILRDRIADNTIFHAIKLITNKSDSLPLIIISSL